MCRVSHHAAAASYPTQASPWTKGFPPIREPNQDTRAMPLQNCHNLPISSRDSTNASYITILFTHTTHATPP